VRALRAEMGDILHRRKAAALKNAAADSSPRKF